MCIVEPAETDGMTELDLAYALVEYALEMSEQIYEREKNEKDPKKKKDPFFRTKTAEEQRSPREASEAYEKVRDAFDAHFSQSDDEFDADALKRVAGTAAVAPALAAAALVINPIATVAGAAFMAGMAKKRAADKAAEEPSRASRARKSKLFQNVVKLSLFMVAAEAEVLAAEAGSRRVPDLHGCDLALSPGSFCSPMPPVALPTR